MWAVEASKFGDNPEYCYVSGLTKEEAETRFRKLYDEGWDMVRCFDRTKEMERDI